MATAPPQDIALTLYPQLEPQFGSQAYRFREASKIKEFFEREIDSHLALYKKYKKLLTTVVSIRYFFLFASVMLNAAGIGALSKILQYDFALYFESASLGSDLLTMILFFIESRVMKKIEKHDEIHTLGASFLSTLLGYFSKALDDGDISQQEIKEILSEQAKYLELRKAVRKHDFHQSDSQDLIKKFREKISKQ